MSGRIKEWKLFKGSIEVVIEAETKKEAEEILSGISHQIISQNKGVYKTRYTMPEGEKK